MSVVHYVPTDEDQLLISTTAGRAKARAVLRDPKISLCVLDERWPFAYLQVYADAVIDRDRKLAVDVLMAVAGRMSGEAPSDETRPSFESMADEEDRIVLRCRATRPLPGRDPTRRETSPLPPASPAPYRGTRRIRVDQRRALEQRSAFFLVCRSCECQESHPGW